MKSKRLWLYSTILTMPLFAQAVAETQAEGHEYQFNVKELCYEDYLNGYKTSCYLDNYHNKIKSWTHLQQDMYELVGNPIEMHHLKEKKGVQYICDNGDVFIRLKGSITWRNFNPGAIRYGSFSRKMGALGSANGFAVFPSEDVGMLALKTLLLSDSYVNMKICDAVHKYAPACDNNNPIRYKNQLHKLTGIDVNRKLSDLSDDELIAITKAIKIIEGWIPGNEEFIFAKKNMLKGLSDIRQTR